MQLLKHATVPASVTKIVLASGETHQDAPGTISERGAHMPEKRKNSGDSRPLMACAASKAGSADARSRPRHQYTQQAMKTQRSAGASARMEG